ELRRARPRIRAAIDLRPYAPDQREDRGYGEEGPEHGGRGADGTGRRSPRALQYADRRRAGESARMVGRALDPRPDSIQAGARSDHAGNGRDAGPGRAPPEEAAIVRHSLLIGAATVRKRPLPASAASSRHLLRR